MNANTIKTLAGRPVLNGLILLALGAALGLAAAKFGALGAAPAPKSPAATPPSVAVTPPPAVAPPSTANGALPFPAPAAPGAWDPFQEMRDMQAQMDQMFQDSLARFHLDPQFNLDVTSGYSLSLDVRDLKDHYEVRAFLPDADSANAKVNLEGNQLKVEVDNASSRRKLGPAAQTAVTESGHYEQVVQLDGNLKVDQMKIKRENHELVITIPKA